MSTRSKFDPLLGRIKQQDILEIPISGGTTVINQSTGGTTVGTGTTVPATGSEGDIFYDTDDGVLYIYANGMWNAISGGGTPPTGIETGGMIATGPLFGITYTI